ncbi:arginine decarboxylase, pyruvoyl-dependent [Methanobacterium alkalithermotolerans]|uniref:Pyruvoyl-dependent arginine decarboxylase n=1 Tax=Methanobacterium alkalithermotolerans TaxID=2731220 RepID=A0A8T8K346_9EURY|nr:arginine decarboxylase, pyruvoyl-dependent [Methanobacterium alkalithermotolerans]QUH22926.1 arginine decarboxylase, pyruvoyl-dependent [Methanobacterium alkalithermotolerans]RJS48747.1 MAG: arginine decarboxylase, pyruvoyl-dependent [Methanobacterium sp.]
MKVAITSGTAEGPSPLNAFDNALLNAGIGDVNLIKVSSIIPRHTKIVELPELTPGDMINCVLSHVSSDNKGDFISAAIAVATSSDFGCVVEHSGVNEDPSKIRAEAISMVKYMMDVRNKSIKELVVEEINHKVENQGSAVAALVYLGD